MRSHFGRFLLHRGCAKLPYGFPTADILSTGCNAVSPRQNVDRANYIGMGGVATDHAPEDRLRLPVLSIHMPTLGARPAGVPGIDGDQLAATPLHLVGKLASELRPALVQDGLIQAALGAHDARHARRTKPGTGATTSSIHVALSLPTRACGFLGHHASSCRGTKKRRSDSPCCTRRGSAHDGAQENQCQHEFHQIVQEPQTQPEIGSDEVCNLRHCIGRCIRGVETRNHDVGG